MNDPQRHGGRSARGRSFQRLRAMSIKELAQISRDPSTYLITLVMPLLLLFLFGFGISLDASGTKVALVQQDDSAAAQQLVQSYRNSRYFAITTVHDRRPAREMMVRSEVRGFIVIPADFGRVVAQGKAPQIQIVTDGSEPNTAQFVAAHASGVFNTWLANEGPASKRSPPPGIETSARFWYNPGLQSRNFLVPASIAVVMTIIGTLLTALVVAREWERGTMEALLATPLRMPEFIASKILPYYFLAMASMTVCTLIAVFFFGVPFRGSILALFLLASAFMFPALGLGLFISAVTKNQFVSSQIALFAGFLPTFLLSGFMYEISSMPVPLQAITYIVPARYLIPSLQTIFLTGDVWPLFLPNMAALLVFGAVFFFLAFRVTRRSLD
ncbi:MAG: ABC transporter permease [Novosphingobium sp.]|nr:ABC transporter permease [Novosphingobium sp.]